MIKAGIFILILGLLITIFTGANFTTKEKVVDIGRLEINVNKKHAIAWPPIFGVSLIAIGLGTLLYDTILNKKNRKNHSKS